jgi:hypothetical protein
LNREWPAFGQKQPLRIKEISMRKALVFAALLLPFAVAGDPPPFTGTWTIDLRTPQDRERKAECGSATFELVQTGDLITGDHSFATVDCGRVNEGGPGTVKGVVIGNTAVLVVTSGRTGDVIMGKATLRGDLMDWDQLRDVKTVEPEGDSPLILGKATLRREK